MTDEEWPLFGAKLQTSSSFHRPSPEACSQTLAYLFPLMTSLLHLSSSPPHFLRSSVSCRLWCRNFCTISTMSAFVVRDGLLRCHRGCNSRLHSTAGDGEVADIDAGGSSPAEHECVKRNEDDRSNASTLKEAMEKLKRYGVSGVLSYGLLNTVYYLTAFLFAWFYVAPAPGKMGYFASVQRFLKIMALVWAGSQVTKIFRAGGALALAPFVDRGLSWFTIKYSFESRGKAFLAIVGFLLGLTLVLFFVITLLWA